MHAHIARAGESADLVTRHAVRALRRGDESALVLLLHAQLKETATSARASWAG